jgi:hypothetical protein
LNSEKITDLYISYNMELLKVHIGENLDDLHYGNHFLDHNTKRMVHKRKKLIT